MAWIGRRWGARVSAVAEPRARLRTPPKITSGFACVGQGGARSVEPLVAYGPAPPPVSAAGSAAASNASTASAFGGATACDGLALGDGTVNGYDVATFLLAHFRTPPYDGLGAELAAVPTVAPRTRMAEGCTTTAAGGGGAAAWMAAVGGASAGNASVSREDWVLRLASDYCAAGVAEEEEAAAMRRRARRRAAARPSGRSFLSSLGAWAQRSGRLRRLDASTYAADLAAALQHCQTTACLQARSQSHLHLP